MTAWALLALVVLLIVANGLFVAAEFSLVKRRAATSAPSACWNP